MPRGGGGGGRSGGGGGGTVHVSGYTRSNGTYVSGYTRSAPSSSSGGGYSGGGSVDVSGYTRSNGTYVSGYTRSAPSSEPRPKPRSSDGDGRVQVSGYTRSDGTEVSGHTRTAPRTEYRNLQLQQERGDAYDGKYETHVSHVQSVEEREEFGLRPERETLRNLRNQNAYTNLSVHKRIDNGLLRMSRSGKFSMQEINRGKSGDASYISPQEVHDRIVQKIEVAKAQGDLCNPRFRDYLYKAADMADVDLRIFNGPQTGRVSGGSAAAEVDFGRGDEIEPLAYNLGTSDSTSQFGRLTTRRKESTTSDSAAVSTSSNVVVKPEHFHKRNMFEGKDSRGVWWPIIIKGSSASRSDCYEVEVEDGVKQVWPVTHPANMRYAEEPPAGGSGGRAEPRADSCNHQ
eukprot:Hpha_TRINITY_DN15297_c3_g5::TRINITY_DN15297_c3_g5_i6::g.65638::m.65638